MIDVCCYSLYIISSHPREGTETFFPTCKVFKFGRFHLTPARGRKLSFIVIPPVGFNFISPPRGDGNPLGITSFSSPIFHLTPARGRKRDPRGKCNWVRLHFISPPRGDGNGCMKYFLKSDIIFHLTPARGRKPL